MLEENGIGVEVISFDSHYDDYDRLCAAMSDKRLTELKDGMVTELHCNADEE